MARVFAVGDLHGCVDELNVLLRHLQLTPEDEIVFLGDYIDRGPASKAVVDCLLALGRESGRCVFLRGNHEDMLLSYLGLSGHYGEAFLYNGGAATLRSYDLEGHKGADLARRLPAGHLEFCRDLRLHHRWGDYLFVHAGIRPGRPLELQSEEDLVWIREEFTREPHDLGCTVVFGHTPYREVLVRLPYRIGLDTGVVYRNKLSCLEVTEGIIHQVQRGAATADSRPLGDLIAPDV